jgi:hypothetical protein
MILMLAPAPNMTFGSMPSSTTYVSDQYSQVHIANNSTADQVALANAGCYTLSPFGGWGTFTLDTLADLYAADAATGLVLPGIVGFPIYTTITIQDDSSNNGLWRKTGTGAGAGNWTQTSATLSPSADAAIAAAAASNAAAVSALMGVYPGTLSAGTFLPFEVAVIENGLGTGSGGTPGTYLGGVNGGPPGFSWAYLIGADGKLDSYWITNHGLASVGTAPTLSFTDANLPGTATVPTAYVQEIPVGRVVWAPSADGTVLLAWTNSGGDLVSAPVGGTQLVLSLDAAISARFSGPIADRLGTTGPNLVNGQRYYTTDTTPPREFVWVTNGSVDPNGNTATADGWVGLYTQAEIKNLGIGFTGLLPSANVQGLTAAYSDLAAIYAVKIGDFQATALTSATNPIVELTWAVNGVRPDSQTITWSGHSIILDGGARSFTPPDWTVAHTLTVFGNSLSDTTDDTSGADHWPNIVAPARGVALNNIARYSSDWSEVYRGGVSPILLTISGDVLPAGGTSASITLINGEAPTADLTNPASFLSIDNAGITTGCTMTGWIGARHVTVSVPNGGSAAYSVEQDAGGAAVTLAGAVQFIPDRALLVSSSDMVIWTGNNYFFSTVPNTYEDYTNPQMWVDMTGMVQAARGNRVLILPVIPDASWTTTGAGTPYTAMLSANARSEALFPSAVARDAAGRTLLQRLQASGNGSANDNADIAAGFTPRSLRILNGDGSIDTLHLSTVVNAGALYAGQAVVAAFVEEAFAAQTDPPAVTQSTTFSLAISGTQVGTSTVTTDTAVATVEQAPFVALEPFGPLTQGQWQRTTGLPRLLLSGTGTVSIDAINAAGAITTGVEAYTISDATNQLEYPYFGADAVAIRATYSNTATAEII